MKLGTMGLCDATGTKGKDSCCACEELLQTLHWESGHRNHGIVLQRCHSEYLSSSFSLLQDRNCRSRVSIWAEEEQHPSL